MAYSILPNMEYEIRCYRITISDLQESDHFQIRIDGKLPDYVGNVISPYLVVGTNSRAT